jgi:hypothetical protein
LTSGGAKVFYTDFPESGKLAHPMPGGLADLAIRRVDGAGPGRKGISSLIAAKRSGIATPLMAEYEAEVLRPTGTSSLEEGLDRRLADVRRRRRW